MTNGAESVEELNPKLVPVRGDDDLIGGEGTAMHHRCRIYGCSSTWPVGDAKAYDIIYGRWWCQSHVPGAEHTREVLH